MTECREGCGACCDPVVLPYNRMEAMTDPAIDLEQRRWAETSLKPMSPREAYARLPWLRGKRLRDQFGAMVQPFFFRCAHFDEVTRTCTDYEHRPMMCREYPWYGGEPRPDASIPPECSYNADIGRVPVALTRKPQSRPFPT